MIDVGEIKIYLQDEVKPELKKVEAQFKLLSKQNAVTVRTKALDILKELNAGMHRLLINAQRNEDIPERIPVNIQICWESLVGLYDEVGRKILSSLSAAEGEVVKIKLLADLERICKKLDFVKSMLILLENEGKKSNR